MNIYDPNKKTKRVARLVSFVGRDERGKVITIDEGCLFYNKHGFLTVKVGKTFYNIVNDDVVETPNQAAA